MKIEEVSFGEYRAYHMNQAKNQYPELRQRSKAVTFALQYQGTEYTLMNTSGFSQDEAQSIVNNYNATYAVAQQYTQDKIQQACVDGYVTGAFGLKLRTPLLKMNGKGKLNYKAAAEGRTVGNMLSQSYGQLNSRAANEFRERVWASEYKYDILPVAQIHDAVYYIWRNTAGIAKWINDNLIDCMKWCELVELRHPTVKLGAALDIFYPDWSIKTTLNNKDSIKDIYKTCKS